MTGLAIQRLVPLVSHGNKAAEITHVDLVGVAGEEEALSQELSSSMSYLTVPFHFTESETTVPTTTLHGLSIEDLDGTAGSRMDLVVDHVLEALVVGGTQEDLGVQFATSEAVVHDFIACVLVAVFL